MDYHLAYVQVRFDQDKDEAFEHVLSTEIYPIIVGDDRKLLDRVISRMRQSRFKNGINAKVEVHVGDPECRNPSETYIDIASDIAGGREFLVNPFPSEWQSLVEQISEDLLQLHEDAVRVGCRKGSFGHPEEVFDGAR